MKVALVTNEENNKPITSLNEYLAEESEEYQDFINSIIEDSIIDYIF